MFLHVGGNTIIRAAEVIAVLNVKSVDSKHTRQFIKNAQKKKHINITGQKQFDPKSILVTDRIIFFSPISASTIKKRINCLNMC